MIRKNITFVNFDDKEVTETFHFNLTKAELLEMEFNANGGMADQLKSIAESDNVRDIYATFKKIVLTAYGEKSEDGKRFLKSEEISAAFAQTEAYSELLLELLNAEKAAAFINALMPQNLTESLNKHAREASEAAMQGYKKPQESDIKQVPELPTAAPVLETKAEDLSNLTREQLEDMLRGPVGKSDLK